MPTNHLSLNPSSGKLWVQLQASRGLVSRVGGDMDPEIAIPGSRKIASKKSCQHLDNTAQIDSELSPGRSQFCHRVDLSVRSLCISIMDSVAQPVEKKRECRRKSRFGCRNCKLRKLKVSLPNLILRPSQIKIGLNRETLYFTV
jgi:hypothetical protein